MLDGNITYFCWFCLTIPARRKPKGCPFSSDCAVDVRIRVISNHHVVTIGHQGLYGIENSAVRLTHSNFAVKKNVRKVLGQAAQR